MPEALTLPHRLQEGLRSHGGRLALRFRRDSTWIARTWTELLQSTAKVAWALRELPRQSPCAWKAEDPEIVAAVSLALLHLGIPSTPGQGRQLDLQLLSAERAPVAYLPRLCQQLHPQDPAWGGRNQGEVAAQAQQRAKRLGPEPLVSAAEVEALAAAGWEGSAMVVGEPSLLPQVEAQVWLATPLQVQQLGLKPSRLGGFGRLARSLGKLDSLVGKKLKTVWVAGEIPPEAASLQQRGVQVRSWWI